MDDVPVDGKLPIDPEASRLLRAETDAFCALLDIIERDEKVL